MYTKYQIPNTQHPEEVGSQLSFSCVCVCYYHSLRKSHVDWKTVKEFWGNIHPWAEDKTKPSWTFCLAQKHIIPTASNFSQFLNNISVAGGPEEAERGQHGGGAVQPHEVPPLHRDLEEGGDRGLVLRHLLLLH